MSILKRCFLAGSLAIACGGMAQAQTTGGTTGGGGGGVGGGGGGGGGGAGGGNNSSIVIQEVEPPVITSTTSTGGNQGASVAASNAFGAYYANPNWQGRAGANTGGLTTVVAPGGFGQALYGTTGVSGAAGAGGIGGARGTAANRNAAGGGGGRAGGGGVAAGGLGAATGGGRTATGFGGAAGGRTTTFGLGGAGGRAGGVGGFGTAGGFGGANNQNAALSTGRQIAYTQTLKFPAAPAVQPVQLQADLQSMMSTSSVFSSNPNIQMSTGDGGLVLLRGTVADADEARLVEGMVRLTPGVRQVRNELTIR